MTRRSRRAVLAVLLLFTSSPLAARAGELPDGAELRLGSTLFRNDWGLSAVAVLPDSRTLVSTGVEIILWDVRSGVKLRTLMKDFQHPAYRLVVSPDGRHVVAACGAYVRGWDVESGRKVFEISNVTEQGEHTMSYDGVDSIAISPAGDTFAAFLGRNDVKVWRVPSGELLRKFNTFGPRYRAVSFSRDGTRLLASPIESQGGRPSAQVSHVWEVKTGDELLKTPRLFRAAISPDGRLLACAGPRDGVGLVSVETGERVRELAGHAGTVGILAFSPDGKAVASGASDGEVILWETGTGKALRGIGAGGKAVVRLRFSPDGTRLLTRDEEGRSALWRLDTGGKLVDYLDGRRPHALAHVAFSPDSRLMVIAEENGYFAWDARTGKRVAGVDEHLDEVARVAFPSDGATIHSAARDNSVATWNAETGRRTAFFRLRRRGRHQLFFADFSSDRKTAVFVRRYESVFLHDTATGRLTRALRAGGGPTSDRPGSHRPTGAAISPDGRTLASEGLSGDVALWDVAAGRRRSRFGGRGTGHMYGSPAFSPDGKRLVVKARREITREMARDPRRRVPAGPALWIVEAASGEKLVELDATGGWEGGRCVFSPDGRLVAGVPYGGPIRLWDAEEGRLICRLVGHARAVTSCEFSPDGKLLVSGGRDRTVRVWDVAARRQVASFEAASEVTSVSFSPDGRRVASAHRNTTVLVWRVPAPLRADPSADDEDDAETF